MTSLDSKFRLFLYVVIAMIGSSLSSIDIVDFTNVKEVVKFSLGLLLVGGTTIRSYIDKSPSEVQPAAKDTMKTIVSLLLLLAVASFFTSCSGVIAGITGQTPPVTPVQREGGTPVNVATSDLLQAEVGPKDKAYGLYDIGLVAGAVGKVSRSAK